MNAKMDVTTFFSCGRPRDLFVARIIDALGLERLHS